MNTGSSSDPKIFLPSIDFFMSIKPASHAAHSFSSDYSYLCYIALYQFAASFCRSKKVLDAACGLGFGSYYLAHTASDVIGIDIAADNIAYAQQQYQKANLSYIGADATATDFDVAQFETIVSLETFEHIPPDKALTFLNELKRLLEAGGHLVISTPNRDVYSQISKTPDHVNELNVEEFLKLLSGVFKSCEPYYQRKGVLKEAKTFYGTVRKDRFKLRRFIPRRIKSGFKKKFAPQLQDDLAKILSQLQVHKAGSAEEVKDAVVQVWVCRNRNE
jgi:SAM-dependent methyltransferase